MASSFEKSVKGATKVKLAPPKTKYIEHILFATHQGEAGVGEIFRALQYRLRESAWTTVFKSLITVHLMIREGSADVTLAWLARDKNLLLNMSITDVQTQGQNIWHYALYLTERARAYRDTKRDWVRAKETRLEKLTVDKGLLRETEAVQHQLSALLKCDVMEGDQGNEITIFVFRLLVLDLLALFQVLNQAMINILGHFFEMSKVDAERALKVYLKFTRQTDYVVQYLSVARQYEHHTRVEVPKLKHAPVNLGRQLEEYLHDPDFEVHRRQYLAEIDAKKKGGSSSAKSSGAKVAFGQKDGASSSDKATSTTAKPAASKGPDPNLIDFFGAIEQNQTPMAVQPQPPPPQLQQPQLQQQQQQQPMQTGINPWGIQTTVAAAPTLFAAQPTGIFQPNGFASQPTGFQPTNPFQMQATGAAFSQPQQLQQPQQPQQPQQQQLQQLQPAYTGMGFGGFTPQPQPQQQQFQPGSLAPIPQNSAPAFQQQLAPPQAQLALPTGQQMTNPFRQSMLLASQTGMQQPPSPLVAQPTSTNPFARASSTGGAPTPAPLVAAKTGTNPFAKDYGGASALQQQQQQQQRPSTAGAASALAPQPTGSTNPFRQTAYMNHQTGLGWQHSQPTGSLMDQLDTVPVFPRPAPTTPWQ